MLCNNAQQLEDTEKQQRHYRENDQQVNPKGLFFNFLKHVIDLILIDLN